MGAVNEGQELVFGLDIGTRSIVGTVGYKDGARFRVLAQRSKEHETRAMLDGQIHDIVKVGETIKEVKEALERDLDRKLSGVCIAAAGRVLRTLTTSVEHTFATEREVRSEDIYALDTMGVEKAYEEFTAQNDSEMQFYCVGYTAMRYYLNGYNMSNLENHKAKVIAADLIATFLPDDVVDGLYKAVELAGLHVVNITLEPIAAIQVAIPEKFRMLNLALVDVGAGTSDISITKEGTITAYGMIPVAGDSLTDIIVQHCLVDFETAENIKRSCGTSEVIEYADILGFPQSITAKEVLELVEPSVRSMVKDVAKQIKDLNGDKAVSAVFVVGGGGMIPGYTEYLAEELGLVKERVAIRGGEVMTNIDFECSNARKDSLMVTPIGICLSYYELSNNFIFVTFNEQRVKLYDNGKLSVVDAAIAAGFSNELLFPRRGKGLVYRVNGKERIARGLQGESATITVDGKEADIHTKLSNGSKIIVTPSTEGEEVIVPLESLPELKDEMTIYVSGKAVRLPKVAYVNGEMQMKSYIIRDEDDIEVASWYTVSQAAALLDMVITSNTKVLVNNVPALPETKVYDTFRLDLVEGENPVTEAVEEEPEVVYEAPKPRVVYEAPKPVVEEPKPVVEAPKPVIFEPTSVVEEVKPAAEKPAESGEASAEATEEVVVPRENINVVCIVNGKHISMNGKPEYVFVDVFDYIDFDLNRSAGRSIACEINGHNADYMEVLKDGDLINIYWRDR